MTSAGSTAISNDNSLGKWMKTGSYKTYSWTCDGMPPNWDNDNYEIPNRVFIIDFCNESHSEYQSLPSWLSNAEFQSTNNSNTGIRVGYKMIPSYDEWQNTTLTSEWNADYKAFIAAKDTLDYFGAVLYPVTRGGDATHLHMYGAVEGGSTIEKRDFEEALGANWPGVSDTKQQVIQGSTDIGFSKYQPLSPATSFTTSDYRNSTSNMSGVEVLTHKVFANNVTSINNPYENTNLKNHNYNGIYDKREVDGVLDFNAVELGEDLNSILQPVQQESMANVVKHFNDEGELFIKGFISETIRFTETDEDCIRMEVKNSSSEDEDRPSNSDNDWTMNGVNMYNANGGNVAIGITDPENQLHVESNDDTIIKVASTNASGKDAGILITTRGSQDWGIFNDRSTKELKFVGHGRPDWIDDPNKPTLVSFNNSGYITSDGLRGGGNVIADADGKLIIDSADGGDDDNDWTRSGSALVPKSSTDYVGIGKGARSGSSNYSLYVNNQESSKAAAFYTDRQDFTVIIRNNQANQNADGLRIDLKGETEQAMVPSTNSGFNTNSRFIDFYYGHGNTSYVNTGSIRIKKNNNCHLTNSSDSRLKANQRPIEYTLDDISSLNLKTFEWKRQKHNYEFIKDIDISSENVTVVENILTVVSENGVNYSVDFDGQYAKVGEDYYKMSAEHDGNKTTIVTFEDEVKIELNLDKISIYSINCELEETTDTAHGVIAQDLLELPKFKDFVFDDTQRNESKGLKEGDIGYSYHSVDYVEFIPSMLAGLQDANKLIKELRQEVDDLKEQLKNKE